MAVGVCTIAEGVAVTVGVDFVAGVGLGVAPGLYVAVRVGVIRGSCSEADGVCDRASTGVSDESSIHVSILEIPRKI